MPLVRENPENLFKTTRELLEAIKSLSQIRKWNEDVEVKVELTYYGEGTVIKIT